VLDDIKRVTKCQYDGSVTFKQFIVVVYKALLHAATHINGNKQFSGAVNVSRACCSRKVISAENVAWSSHDGAERQQIGKVLKMKGGRSATRSALQ